MGRLERKLDLDLIERMEAGNIYPQSSSLKRVKPPRKAETYRGARGNAVRARHARQLAEKRAAPGYVDHHKRQKAPPSAAIAAA